jgi:dTDP-4-amino-4,6-dideoxygalactose transaminase
MVKMKVKFNVVNRFYLRNKLGFLRVFNNVMTKGNFILGNEVERFENNFARYVGTSHCVGVNSGLDALIFALKALNIKEGDEVIVPANTFIATILAISEVKAKPVLIEPDEFYNIDSSKIKSALSRNTKAIIVVHLYGQTADMDPIVKLCKENNLYLVEDCAQSHGAKYKGKMTGSFGDVSCFSFYPTKNLGAYGDGGCITTNNQNIYEKVKLLRNYGSKKKYHHDIIGFNSRLDEIQAALLNYKMKFYYSILQKRKLSAQYYIKNIKNKFINLPKIKEHCDHVFHLFVVETNYREELIEFLIESSIEYGIHYPIPAHQTIAYSSEKLSLGLHPITEKKSKLIISLPLFDFMKTKELKYVVNRINKFTPTNQK